MKQLRAQVRIIAVLAVFAVGIAAVYVYLRVYADVRVDPALEDPAARSFPGNYILFVGEQGHLRGSLYEINGWLLLESLLYRHLGSPVPERLERVLVDFCDELGRCGWWQEKYMQAGKRYFVRRPPVRLRHDLDDTVWALRLRNTAVPESVVREFVSDTDLPEELEGICSATGCRRSAVLRVWSDPDWHDDVDIVSTANALSYLSADSAFMRTVIAENVRLINYIIEKKDWRAHSKYYEPKVTAAFLLLLYDREGGGFLTPRSREFLLRALCQEKETLKGARLVARWGGGADVFYGITIATVNAEIPGLMLRYAQKYLCAQTQGR